MKKRILIVEDDAPLAHVLRDNLLYEGFDVDWVADGREAITQTRAARPDLILLDVMVPGLDGFAICEALNVGRDRLPIIMLTARSQKQDRLRGLKLGADDYVTKPFSFDELLARIQAVLRRSYATVQTLFLGDVRIDFTTMRAWKGKVALSLTAHEFAILHHLAERPGRVVVKSIL